MRRTPLNLLDQQFLPWDQVAPLRFLCELRVQGRLDGARVADAVRGAVSRHPMTRSRLACPSWRHRGQYWEIVDDVRDVPLEIIECPDDEALEQARARLLEKKIDLRSAPPFALVLARRAGGDSLCMSLSHVVLDGVSSYRLMRSIACAYAGVADPIAGPDPLAVRDLSFYNGATSAVKRIQQLRRSRKLQKAQPHEAPPARLATVENDQSLGEPHFRDFHLLHLDRAETRAVMARRRAPATFNDLLLASLALAVRRWNDSRGVAPGRLDVQMPLNLRPPEWAIDVVSNLVANVNIVVPELSQHDLASAQVEVARQTRQVKSQRARAEIGTVTIFNVIPLALRYPLARRLLRRPAYNSTVALSNLGPVEFPDFGYDAGPVTEFWLNPSRGSGSGTIAAALSLRDELFVALHRKIQLDGAGARGFADLWRDVLLRDA